jgi:tetratricopeptide (TPR) repeat protein
MTTAKALIGLAVLYVAACGTLGLQGEFTAGRQALLRGDSAVAFGHFARVAQGDANYISGSSLLRESIWTYLGRAQYGSGNFSEAKDSFEKALSHFGEDPVARLYLGLTLLRLPAAPRPSNAFSPAGYLIRAREGVEPKRVVTLVRERGVDFDLTKETENQLRNAGADTLLVDEIKKSRTEIAKRRKAEEAQRMQGTKELTSGLTTLRDWLNYSMANTVQGKFLDPSGDIRLQIQNCLKLLSARAPDWPTILSSGERVGQKVEEEIDLVRRDEREESRRSLGR